MKYSEYVSSKDPNAHREYYGQFVDEEIKRRVLLFIGREAIIASTDPHFNDIPLRKWDNLAGFYSAWSEGWKAEKGEDGRRRVGVSLANCVCIYKEAARQIKEGEVGDAG